MDGCNRNPIWTVLFISATASFGKRFQEKKSEVKININCGFNRRFLKDYPKDGGDP